MDFYDITIFIIVLLCSGLPIVIAHQLYNRQVEKFYLHFIYYDAFGKAFFLTDLLGRHFVDRALSSTSSTPHTQILVGLVINFVAYPFLGISTYFFASFMGQLCQKKLPSSFKWPYLIWFSAGVVFFISIIREVIDSQIQNWSILNNDTGIIIGNMVFYSFFYFGIFLLFYYSRHLTPVGKKNKIRLLGYYYLLIYSMLFFHLLVGQRYLEISNMVVFVYVFGFNIPVAVYFKYHLQFFFQRPSSQSIKDIQAYFSSFNIANREAEIISLVCNGKTNKEISDVLFLSLQTVKNSLYNIYKKIGVKSRVGLINSFYKEKKN